MDKEVIWLHSEIKAPPFSEKAQEKAGFLLRRLQQGKPLTLPHSRPMPSLGSRCHELRIRDEDLYWRIVYRIDEEAILVVDVFPKKTEATPLNIISSCRKRLTDYDQD